MQNRSDYVLLGARVPGALKEKLSEYCTTHGIKMNYFVMKAIQEKLQETEEETQDLETAKERLKNPEFVSENELEKYVLTRKRKT